MDNYWNYQEDLNDLHLKDETGNFQTRQQIDQEQKLLSNRFIKNEHNLRAKLADAVALYKKDYQETYNAAQEHGGIYQGVQNVISEFLPEWAKTGPQSTKDITKRNLKNVNAKHKENIQKIYRDAGLGNVPVEMSFDPKNPDAATIMNAPSLSDLMSNPEFAGPELTRKYNESGLHPSTMNSLVTYSSQNLEQPLTGVTSLSSMLDKSKPGKSDIFPAYVNATVQNQVTQPNYVNIPYNSSMPQRGY